MSCLVTTTAARNEFVPFSSFHEEPRALVLLAAVVAGVMLYQFDRPHSWRATAIDTFKLRMPLFGNLKLKTAISSFCATLGPLVTSVFRSYKAIEYHHRELQGHSAVARAIARVHDRVNEGESIVPKPWQAQNFSPMSLAWSCGEETGKLPECLLKIAEVYMTRSIMLWPPLTSMLNHHDLCFWR